ncbi:MAG: ThuA domain-containing protein [Planctomycetota bacterium]
MIRSMLCLLFVSSMLAIEAFAQHDWQKPPRRDPETVAKILGDSESITPTRDLKIVWVWGVDEDHEPGFHEYGKVKEKFAKLFRRVPRVTFEEAQNFPSDEQWESADLIVFYLQLAMLSEDDFDQMDSFLRRGKGIVAIHSAFIHPGQELADRFGLAWDPDKTQWGALPSPISIDPAMPLGIMEGFSNELDFVDEHYWNLVGSVDDITVLATAPAGTAGASSGPPAKDSLDGKAWPLFWAKDVGKGRVFGSIPGHNMFTFDDPYFRIILLRAMAWTMRQPFDPFKPLVAIDP